MMENGEWNGQEQRKRKIDLGEDKEGDKSRMVKGKFSQRAHQRPLSALFFSHAPLPRGTSLMIFVHAPEKRRKKVLIYIRELVYLKCIYGYICDQAYI